MNIALAFGTLAVIALLVSGQPIEKENTIDPLSLADRSNANSLPSQLAPFLRLRMIGDGVGKRIPWMLPKYVESKKGPDDYESYFAPWFDSRTIVVSGYSASDNDDGNIGIVKKNTATPNAGGGMWFGPRLGKRRKRSIELF